MPTPITLLCPQPPPVQRGRLPSIEGADTVLAQTSQVAAEAHTHGRQLLLDSTVRSVDIVSILGTVSWETTHTLPAVCTCKVMVPHTPSPPS